MGLIHLYPSQLLPPTELNPNPTIMPSSFSYGRLRPWMGSWIGLISAVKTIGWGSTMNPISLARFAILKLGCATAWLEIWIFSCPNTVLPSPTSHRTKPAMFCAAVSTWRSEISDPPPKKPELAEFRYSTYALYGVLAAFNPLTMREFRSKEI